MTPNLEFVFELKADLSPAIDLGPTPDGFRRIIGIVSGTLEGPLLQGVVLPGGADWQIIRSDEVTELHAHYILSTDDAVLIQVNVRGLRHARGGALARIEAGEIVDPSEYYFRVAPIFQAPEGRYSWLNQSIFVGSGQKMQRTICLKVFRIV